MTKHSCHHSLSEAQAREVLNRSGLSRTKAKMGILITLSEASSPLSVAEIHKLLGGDASCDVSTVFRSITQFKEKGIIRESNLGEDFFRYELIGQEDHHHHHHVRCRDCGVIKPLPECDLSAFEKAILNLGFEKMEHHLEFTGICVKCLKDR
jgi:Fur family transcriptional regulator, ferric uptake regulator